MADEEKEVDVPIVPAVPEAVPEVPVDPRADLEARATALGIDYNHTTPNELLQQQVEEAEGSV